MEEKKAVRKSKQRQAILDDLKSRYDHPTAAEIYETVKKGIPSLSLGTLYRNLNFLCESGEINRFSTGAEEHYDAVTSMHYHLKCSCCGRFFDLPISPIYELEKISLPEYKGKIDSYSLVFYGVCEECSLKRC